MNAPEYGFYGKTPVLIAANNRERRKAYRRLRHVDGLTGTVSWYPARAGISVGWRSWDYAWWDLYARIVDRITHAFERVKLWRRRDLQPTR